MDKEKVLSVVKKNQPIIILIGAAIVLTTILLLARAGANFLAYESEGGNFSGNVDIKTNTDASGGNYVEFVGETPKVSSPFYSGFEDTTYSFRKLVGGQWDDLPNILGWMNRQMVYYQPDDSNPKYPISVVNDPTGSNKGKVLKLKTADIGSPRRAQWSIWQHDGWNDTGKPNQYVGHTFSYDIYIEPITTYDTNQRSSWLMLWESHAWNDEPTRHGLYLEKRSGSDSWYLRMVQERPEGTLVWQNTQSMWNTTSPIDPNLVIPLGQWARLEIDFIYHPTNGEFRVRLNDKVIGEFTGKTQSGRSLFDIELFKLYHDGAFGSITAYYDNVEIKPLEIKLQ